MFCRQYLFMKFVIPIIECAVIDLSFVTFYVQVIPDNPLYSLLNLRAYIYIDASLK